jgi:hypothetical protein
MNSRTDKSNEICVVQCIQGIIPSNRFHWFKGTSPCGFRGAEEKFLWHTKAEIILPCSVVFALIVCKHLLFLQGYRCSEGQRNTPAGLLLFNAVYKTDIQAFLHYLPCVAQCILCRFRMCLVTVLYMARVSTRSPSEAERYSKYSSEGSQENKYLARTDLVMRFKLFAH